MGVVSAERRGLFMGLKKILAKAFIVSSVILPILTAWFYKE